MKKQCVPIVSPVACTRNGTILNINADTIATELAITLKTEKLIFLTDVEGVYKGEKLLRTLTVSEVLEGINKKSITDGMAVKMESCIRAIKHGVKRVHIINGKSVHSLRNEVLTKKGVGTMVVSDKEKIYENKEAGIGRVG